MIRYDEPQGSDLWFMRRAGVVTASEMDNLISPTLKVRTGDMPKTYLAKKIAEAWGGPLIAVSGFAMEQGNIIESIARPWFELEYDVTVDQVGFLTTDDGRLGCSPDGLLGEEGGLEIKAPLSHTHVQYFLDGILPPDYKLQVYTSMMVTNRPWWKFMSYRHGFPNLVLHIERDEAIEKVIRTTLNIFLDQFDAGMAKLKSTGVQPPNWKRIPNP